MPCAQRRLAVMLGVLSLVACDPKGEGPSPDTDADADTDTDTDTGSRDCLDTGGGTDPGWTGPGDSGGDWPPPDHDCDGYGVERGDCDDWDPERGPAAVEIAGDGVDANCDGLDVEVEGMDGVFLDDAPSYTRAGSSLAAGDVDGDGLIDLVVSTPGTFNNELAREAYGAETSAIVVPGPITERRVLSDETCYGGPKAAFGGSDLPVATPGDMDGDGYEELVYSFPYGDGATGGVVLVAYGPAVGSDGSDAAQIVATGDQDGLGYGLASPGDLDGDGRPELLVSAVSAGDRGEIYAFSDPAGATLTREDAVFLLSGEDEGAHLGSSMAADDLDDDGYPDLVVGRFLSSTDTGAAVTRVWVLRGPLAGAAALSSASAVIDSDDASQASIGRAIAPVGDADGDGRRDLALGSESFHVGDDRFSAEGRASLLLAPVEGALSTTDAAAVFSGLTTYDGHGRGPRLARGPRRGWRGGDPGLSDPYGQCVLEDRAVGRADER